MSDDGDDVSDSFFDVVARQRACRSFTDEAVDDDTIARILTAATFAPSAENKQPWEFVVVRDRQTRTAIGDLSRRAWEAHGRAFSETRLTPAMLAEVDRGATSGVADAPVNIVVCADVQRGLEVTIPSSIFPATQNLLLAATALGLGSALDHDHHRLSRRAATDPRAPGSCVADRARAARSPGAAARTTEAHVVHGAHPPGPIRPKLGVNRANRAKKHPGSFRFPGIACR